MNWEVPYINLSLQFRNIEDELTSEFRRVMEKGAFILRDDVTRFETDMAKFLNVNHVIGVNSGTDALYLSLKALNLKKGDEVITVGHTFVATIAAIFHGNGVPILVDIRDDFNIDVNKIEEKITNRTKAIIPVHLNGRLCEMDKLLEIADNYNLSIVEDACQSLGSKFNGENAGSFGILNCFSVHPMKTINCAGDGGFVSSNNDEMSQTISLLRNHGQKTKEDLDCFGFNSRLDNLQAAILNVKLKYLDKWISRRREIAAIYDRELQETSLLLPSSPDSGVYFDTYNSYVIRSKKRDELYSFLRGEGIEVFVHIDKPLYHHKKLNIQTEALPLNEKICKEIISLPIYPEMTNMQVEMVISKIQSFVSK